MRKVLSSILALSFIILNLAIHAYGIPEAKKKNIESLIEEQQSVKNKKKYKWEFSTSASLDISYDSSSDTSTIISIPIRIGFFLTKNLEIEPEINWKVKYDGNPDSEILLLANLAHNFDNSSQVIPFILGGIGIIRMSKESAIEPYRRRIATYLALNAGAGLKWFATKRVALRAEYRFINYNKNGNSNKHHKIFLGVSIFF